MFDMFKKEKKTGKKTGRKENKETDTTHDGKDKPREISVFREYFEMFAEVLAFLFFINTFLFQSQAIPTSSMEDTLLIGDHLLVDKVAFCSSLGKWDNILLPRIDINRGMSITFKGPPEMSKDYVKRVIALPGETIRIKENKVYINGKLLDEPYTYFKGGGNAAHGSEFPLQAPRIIDVMGTKSYLPFLFINDDNTIDEEKTHNFCKRFESCVYKDPQSQEWVFKVPEAHYFCMGDNRDNSHDSRFWGPLPRENVIGKPWVIYWSYKSETKEYLTPGIIHKIKDLFSTAIHFFTRTRWNRTFKKAP